MSHPSESGEPPSRRLGEVFGSMPHPHIPGMNISVNVFDVTRMRAEAGDAEAQFQLSVMYQNGRLIAQDPVLSLEWLRKAAAQRHVKAMFNLGVTYGDGLGVPVDDAEAFKWYQAAAAQGEARAYYNLGSFYLAGRGTAVDGAKANAQWFEAALRGLSLAQVRLALSFARGDGGKVDHQLAYIWAYIAKDKEPDAVVVLEAIAEVISPEEVAALEREAHGVIEEMMTIAPDDKRRFSAPG
jgi:hypothetical protein